MKKRFGKIEALLLVSGICFALLIGEFAARIWLKYFAEDDDRSKYTLYTDIPLNEWKYSPHHYLTYYPTPNYKKGLVSHNSLGFRGDGISAVKPKGEYRIALLGESSTYDTSIMDNRKTFAAKLKEILGKKYNYKNIEVVNAGAGGYNSWESLINLEFRVLDIEPDLVIVNHGVNDVHSRLVKHTAYKSDNSGRRTGWYQPPISFWQKSYLLNVIARRIGLCRQINLETATTSRNAIYMFNESKRDSDKIIDILKANPPVYFERNLSNMIAIAKENNIDIILSTWAHSPYFDDYVSTRHYEYGVKENNDVVKKVAERHHVPLFDFEKVMPTDKYYWADGRHLDDYGAEKKAELFADFIHEQGLIEKKSL